MVAEPFYDPARSYQDNFEHGPFGLFANTSQHSLSHHPKAAPKHTFLGHPVAMPFGIPAGPLLNGRYVKAALDMGFDIPVYKTVRTHQYPCHPWPNVLAVKVEGDLHVGRTLVAGEHYAEPLSITNSFGVPTPARASSLSAASRERSPRAAAWTTTSTTSASARAWSKRPA
jgi:dihydroorotate dehydrogenase (NAD+) catalytic subunit